MYKSQGVLLLFFVCVPATGIGHRYQTGIQVMLSNLGYKIYITTL